MNTRLTTVLAAVALAVVALSAPVVLSGEGAYGAGYRWQHVSNGNTSQPNRGFESSVAVAGLSRFF